MLTESLIHFIPFRGMMIGGGPPAVTKKDLIILKESLRCLAEKNADTREALVERIENIQMELVKERGKRGTLRMNHRK